MSELVTYLQSYDGYFWQYEDMGKVIAVPNGRTIGYSKLILSEIVDHLASQGLPRFGTLLLATVATNPHGLETLDNILSTLSVSVNMNDEIHQGIRFAKLLSQLPVRYKKGKLRLELFRALFQNSHNSIGKTKSRAIQMALKEHTDLTHYKEVLIKKALPSGCLRDDFRTLGLIAKDLTSTEAIIARVANLPTADDLFDDINFSEQNNSEQNDLIENLIKDKRTFHVGSLVSRLMSGLNIPFHSSLPSTQPLGGVADITNKGNYDKLLISELAFDDDVLMSRLANNESLYTHREVPPSDNNYNRVIIIDITLKNWGTIRTISFASMLAISKHPKSNNPCRVFIVGKSYKEISFESPIDIIDAMLVMDSSLDPGLGLLKLFTEETIQISEIFFIGNHESLDQPAMQLFNAEYGKRIDHWIHPNSEGAISVYKNPKRGKRFIQEIKLSLTDVWSKSKVPHPETTRTLEYDYPILFPRGYKHKSLWIGKQYCYLSTKNKSLLRQYGSKNKNHHSGLELLDANFPNSYTIRAVITHDDLSATLLVSEHHKEMYLVETNTDKRLPVEGVIKSDNNWKYYTDGNYFICGTTHLSYTIHLDGTSEKRDATLFKIDQYNHPTYYTKQIFRNLKSVSISLKGKLRFGKHELILNGRNLKLQNYNFSSDPVKLVSDASHLGLFKFNDGSHILHNRNGMLTLVSSSEDIPNIFLPCVLSSTLAVATENSFAGDHYYRMDLREELFFDGEIINKSEAEYLTQTILGIHSDEAKMSINKGIVTCDKNDDLYRLQKALSESGIKTTIKKRGLEQELISATDFYKKYIQSFIDQILSHDH